MKLLLVVLIFAGAGLASGSPVPVGSAVESVDGRRPVLPATSDECCREELESEATGGNSQIAMSPEPGTLVLLLAGILFIGSLAGNAGFQDRKHPRR